MVVGVSHTFLSPLPDAHKLYEIINVYCFKLVGLGVTCHTAIDNAERQREERRGDGVLLKEVKITLGPEERGMDQVKRSWVGASVPGKHESPAPRRNVMRGGGEGAQAAGM